MSFGHLAACPCCWEDPEDCKCTTKELSAYYKRVEKEQKRIRDFTSRGKRIHCGKRGRITRSKNMTLNQLETLNEDELALCLFINNVTFPMDFPKLELTPRQLTWLRHDALVKKLLDAFPRLKSDAHPIYTSLMQKLGVCVQIKQQPTNIITGQEPLIPIQSPPSESICQPPQDKI
jgi:hypothetical protein